MFETDILTHRQALHSYALKLSGHVDRAEDLVQDTLVKALLKQHQFEVGTNLKSWLFTILRNHYFSSFRKRRPSEDPHGIMADTMVSPALQDITIQFKELKVALENLSPAQKRSIVMVLIEGHTYEEAAEAEGVALGTMKSRVCRARAMLKDQLGDLVEDVTSNNVRTYNDNLRSNYR